MKNLRQIELVNYSLSKEKEKVMFEIARLNTVIGKKVELINKMAEYQRDYGSSQHLFVSRVVPALHRNLDSFSNRLKDIVVKEEKEVESLLVTRETKLKKMNFIDQKLKTIQKFAEAVHEGQREHKDQVEQRQMDDLAVIKLIRSDYE